MEFDRAWYQEAFLKLFRGWYRVLEETSDSSAVWQPKTGVIRQNFVSKSGLQCDGVSRMMPALAAWAAQAENPETICLNDRHDINVRDLLHRALVNGCDPENPDFWGRVPGRNQRQVEASIVAWSLWLSRDWLIPRLSRRQIQNIQAWFAACTVVTDHFNNWSLFTATNHAARYALREHGFDGSLEEIRRDLIPGNELYAGDGWMFDMKYSNIDYYNFWVFGSHHCYLRAMLPNYKNPMLIRALRKLSQRLPDLQYLIDANGLQVQFGRSLPYRWGWLTGLVAAHYIGISTVDPGLSRAMLARNLQAWFDLGSINKEGALREKLSPGGSEGGASTYINCGHPYWGMQAFLCLALPNRHPFWSAPAKQFPVEEGDFQIPRQGPGFVFQGIRASGEVRLFSIRNAHHHREGSALYDKFVYSTAFPCNSGTSRHHTAWDNQFALRLADGRSVKPSAILEVDVHDGRTIRTIRSFSMDEPAKLRATVHTRLTISGHSYTTEHEIDVQECGLDGAQWVEGGFPLPFDRPEKLRTHSDGNRHRATAGERSIASESCTGWEIIHSPRVWKSLWPGYEEEPNILYPYSVHCLLTAAVKAGRCTLASRHEAEIARE